MREAQAELGENPASGAREGRAAAGARHGAGSEVCIAHRPRLPEACFLRTGVPWPSWGGARGSAACLLGGISRCLPGSAVPASGTAPV